MKQLSKVKLKINQWKSDFTHYNSYFKTKDFRKEYKLDGIYSVSELVKIQKDLERRLQFVKEQITKEVESAAGYNRMLEERHKDIL